MTPTTARRSGYVAVDAARLYYEERGAGPTLLFVPGGSVDATNYAGVAERLADQFRVVTYDRRGTGRSPRPAGWHATSIAEQADDVAGLVEALGLAPCAVWGGSLGGVVLLELLVRRPGLVRAAVVHEPPLFALLNDGDELARGLLESAARAVRHGTVREEFRAHVHQAIGPAFDELPIAARERMFANAEVFFDLEVPALVDHRPDPARLVRVVRGADVPVTVAGDPHSAGAPPWRAARRLAELLGTELQELPGGHMPYAIRPVETAAAVRAAITHP